MVGPVGGRSVHGHDVGSPARLGQPSARRIAPPFCRRFGRPPIDRAADLHLLAQMIAQSQAHLTTAGESYFQHWRFATTVGLMAMAAGIACLIHALVPALCTRTASRTIGLIGELFQDRDRLEEIEARSIEATAFVLLI